MVSVDDFLFFCYEVMQAEWVVLILEYMFLYNRGVGFDYFIYCVSWYDVAIYCNWLSFMEGWILVYYFDVVFIEVFDFLVGDQLAYVDIYWDMEVDGYCFFIEVEWEYVVRGGVVGLVMVYVGSNDFDVVAWYSGNSNVNS